MKMSPDLKTLNELRDSLKASVDAAVQAIIKDLPQKKDLDAVERSIFLLGGAKANASEPTASPAPVFPFIDLNPKPRALATEEQKRLMLSRADNYWLQTKNKPTTIKQLAPILLDGMDFPPDKAVYVVSGIITRNPKYVGKEGYWNIKEFADA